MDRPASRCGGKSQFGVAQLQCFDTIVIAANYLTNFEVRSSYGARERHTMSNVTRSLFAAVVWLGVVGATGCTAHLEGGAPNGPVASGGSGSAGGASAGGPGVATDPGRVTLHRLNRAEYNNTVADLLGTSLRPADDFPIDDRGSGFDNMADVLTLSPLHLSVFHGAARTLVGEALRNTEQRERLVTCDLAGGDTCVRDILKAFAYRAWRRPVAESELDRLLAIVGVARENGDSVEEGLSLALQAVLLSPHFIFRVELDENPTSTTPHPLSPYELATRLSYFLWSSTPDATLLASAQSGALWSEAALREQATRLLQDARAQSLVENFAGQWLHLRAIETLEPDSELFPNVDAGLLEAMKAETELVFRDIAFSNTPLVQLLTGGYSYINDRLAAHYGLPAVGSSAPTRVDLTGNTTRGGLLSHAGFLTLTSHPNRTSPVVRGKWVMDELLCATVPPPPPDVNLAGVSMAKEQGLTQREALEIHRADPKCFSCHQMMDPIGLGLENYDAIGGFRTMDAGSVIDAAGQLPSGETFAGAQELAARIAAKPEFARCAAKKLYTYALGRPPVESAGHLDTPTLDGLAQALQQGGFSWPDLVARIVTSPTFTQRRGEPPAGAMP
jgi:hypothetical protein